MIYLPRGIPVREKINPARINLPEAMEKLRVGTFSGYLRFDSPQGTGVIIFEKGKLVSALFVSSDETERLIAYDAIARIFDISIAGHAILNIFRFSAELAMEIHALLHGRYICKGEDLNLIDIRGLLDRIKQQQINGCLRVYNEEKVALIFYDHGNALGFFHEGGSEIDVTADLSKSVARLPGARIDLLEMQSSIDIVLADLMGSADLGPIWQRARKVLLKDRRKQEEAMVRSLEEEQELRRQRILATLKTIAGGHIGKFGISQVEKAFSLVGPEVTQQDLGVFYNELQRLAKLVASPQKITAMLDEMKRQFNSGT